jgi:hypothetical protein
MPGAVSSARIALAPLVAAVATMLCAAFQARAEGGGTPVDVELILAVDVSYSMDEEEQRLQRAGYVEALRSRQFAEALKAGVHGKVAIAYMEWAGAKDQWVVAPFTLVDGPAAAAALADKLAAAPIRRWRRTSISGALDAAVRLFSDNGFEGLRRVVDVSGDGPNNEGRSAPAARDSALTRGVVINGLPLLLKRPSMGWGEIPDLDVYYEECVVGGPGAFVLPIRDKAQFVEATRTKLVLEIAAAPPPPSLNDGEAARVEPAQTRPKRADCAIGERLWRERWEN